MSESLVVTNLSVDYRTSRGITRGVDGADLHLAGSDSVGLVGESGSGKSTLALAIGGLLPATAQVQGDIHVAGLSVLSSSSKVVRSLRRDYLGFVFQSPMAALDPTRQIRKLLGDLVDDQDRIVDLLRQVALPTSERILNSYPHQLSGGMAQRVAVAMAIARRPKLLIADEPTSSLDSSVRNQVLSLLFGLRASIGASIVFLSHDLHIVRRYCNRIAVMYGGRIVEEGPTAQLLRHPTHPYTSALLATVPGTEGPDGRLEPIPGSPPRLAGRSESCAFAPRCRFAIDVCNSERPKPVTVGDQNAICFRATELKLPGS